MKKILTSFLLILIVFLCYSYLCAQQSEVIEKYSKVKITIHDRTDLQKLQLAGLSLEGMKLEENSLELILSEREIMKLRDIGFSYETLIDDMTEYYRDRSRRTEAEMKNLEREMKEKYSSSGFGFGSMGGFYTFDEVVAELDTMRMLYPNLITAKYSIGSTIEGRTIWAVKISDNPDVTEGEPEVFYNALIHAREPAGMMSVIYFMYHLLENYGTDPEITYLVDNRELFFVPVINVDGFEYNHQMAPNGGYMWRKNKCDNNLNGTFEEGYDGVDLNRNFGYMWGYNNIGSSSDPPSEIYRGTAPFSEPEIQVIRDFCNNHNFDIAVNFHAYWDVIFTSWEYILEQTPDSNLFNNTISLATVLNGYENGWYTPDSYELNGSANDWMYGEQTSKPKIYAYLPEVGNDNDGFWPIPDRIFPIASENCFPNKVLAWGPGVIDDPPHITEGSLNSAYYVPSVDSVHIDAIESNPENYNSVLTAYLYDIADNLIDEFEMSEISANTFYASYQTPQEENFYYFLLKDEGVVIPSNFYYKKNLKFTTAGPVVINNIEYTALSNFRYTIKPYLKNNGTTAAVTNLRCYIFCDDPWVTSLSPAYRDWPNMLPGEIKTRLIGFTVSYDSATFPGYFNFKVEVMSDGWSYWRDSLQIIVGIEETLFEIPTEFSLSQNYPNPFNPSTVISYQLPVSSEVTLKVFDLLGNEVVTLVNEYKPAGHYVVEFQSAEGNRQLASGVYFYQLKAGEYINTKKMILLK